MRPPRISPPASRLPPLASRLSHLALRISHFSPRARSHARDARQCARRTRRASRRIDRIDRIDRVPAGSRLGGERRAAVASRPGPPLASLAPAPRLLIAPRLITNRELLLCVLRARFV
ncbi:hypothetical protein DO72_4887 [Burkholderia pseudomallei]|nr:hypothetical protein DO72_4887 [Burkholderia pseudomallei]